MTATQVLRVSRFDPASSTSKQKQIIQLEKSVEHEKLSDIRELLQKNSVFDSKDFKSPFCRKNGSDVSDDMKFGLYLALLGVKSISEPRLDVYFKAKKIFSPVDKATQDSNTEQLDLAFQQEPELIKKNPELLTSSFNPSDWTAVKGELSHAADLTEREWSVITRTNCLLSGHRIVTTPKLDGETEKQVLQGIERSPYNAFKLKPRAFESYEVSSMGQEDTSRGDDEKYHFRIPRFRVDDDSSVTVVETKTSFEKSMAKSSFSETSFQVAASASFFGVSGSAQAGGSTGSTDSSSSLEAKEENSLVVNYNFPRVTLYWDYKSLAVSQECLDDIKTVVDLRTAQDFHQKYGHVFSRRVQLGGRLSSSQKVVSTEGSKVKEQAQKLKASASASINSSFFQASVSASHERQSKEGSSSSKKDFSSSMAWEATGGDTLLCNNPAQWCATVSLHDNWRIVNQDEVVPLYKFLARFPEVGHSIIDRFENAVENIPQSTVPKYNFQVFQLNVADLLWLAVENDDTKIFDTIKETTGYWAEDKNTAAASVKLSTTAKPSDISTRFVVSKDMETGKNGNIRYGEAFRANSLGHPKHWTLASHITQPKSARKTDLVWAHLVGEHGSICLYKKDDPANRDYVRNNDAVYVCLINTNGINPQGPQLIDNTNESEYLRAKQVWRPGQVEPPTLDSDGTLIPFTFKLLEPYEGEYAPGSRS
ncbi:uncharacterized protein B0J16DRAFT_336234 [Fusarium flagelliforme]|uniref:uncharacterized protein n=1 Tax=Fusarium flagelliforme TaxID=2675880 RepID=UPI001E8D4CE9|nr:uncharacterized protein B0J16DRAFT_336234 [Fusarium flagelliforme]KAH7193915.1 hypothetical protein B0J16DRAFT_336234 [Fusarium flagelliforme]